MAEIFKKTYLSEQLVYLREPTATLNEDSNESPEQINTRNCSHSKISTSCGEDVGEERAATNTPQAIEEGYNAGFSKGLSEGLEHGTQLARSQENELLNQLANYLEKIPSALAESRLQLKTDIAHIVLTIVESFFIQQQQSQEAIEQQINDTLQQLNHQQSVTLFLHPQDFNRVQQGLIKIDRRPCNDIRLATDEGLQLGGCLIKSEHGLFDASIESQIDRLKQALLQIKSGIPL